MSSAITPELRWHAIGRRKVGVARVYLTPGSGKWNINGRTLGDYFPRPSLVSHIQQPFTATDTLGAFDVRALVRGGGVTGQAGALRLGIARALCLADDRHRKKLRENGLLTRDPRVVERKKPGRAGARKRFQFSKRYETGVRCQVSDPDTEHQRPAARSHHTRRSICCWV